MKFKSLIDVVRWRLCVGCGACQSVCPEQRIELVDVEDEGIRPVVLGSRFLVLGAGERSAKPTEPQREQEEKAGNSEGCEDCRMCLEVRPGLRMRVDGSETGVEGIPELKKQWGTVLEVWEGYAFDPEIRFRGSSGGLCTALSLFCLEKEIANGTTA